ncbi:MAG: hypothetical protein ABI488_03890 [Polyangiaceae bacterium]
MRYARALLRFCYDFIIGDDWVIAFGVVLVLVAVHRLVQAQINAWWLMPGAAILLLAVSLWRGAREPGSR